MKVISPRQVIMVVLVMFASMTQTAHAQEGLFDFLTNFDFDALLASICPILVSLGVELPFCSDSENDDETGDDETGDDGGAPAPTTKKGKIVAGTSAPVAPSATP